MANEEIKKDAELEGKKLEDEKTEDAAGGVNLDDLPNPNDYAWAGVTWEHHFWSKDRYFIRGVEISKEMADKIVDKAYELGRPLTDEELRQLFGIHV